MAVAVRVAGFAAALLFLLTASTAWAQPPRKETALRPPAVPLIVHDPYLSIWSPADRLTDANTQHWTRREHPLVSLIRIDGKSFRLMGTEPKDVPAMKQVGVRVFPTRSVYDFDDGHVHVTLTFMTPALPDDLDVLARPLTYLTWEVRSLDRAGHTVSIYESTSALLAVNTPDQQVDWTRVPVRDMTVLGVGTVDQTLLQPAGDETRIDWGYAYAAAPSGQSRATIGASAELLKSFVEHGTLPEKDDTQMPRAASERQPCLAFVFDLGRIGTGTVSRHLMVAYDELYAIKFLGQKLRPYWRRNGATLVDLVGPPSGTMPIWSIAASCSTICGWST